MKIGSLLPLLICSLLIASTGFAQKRATTQGRTCNQDRHLRGTEFTIDSLSQFNFDCSRSQYNQDKLNEFQCMACNLYFESEGEGFEGKKATGEVTLNSQAYELNVNNYTGPKPICHAVFHDKWRFAWTRKKKAIVKANQLKSKRAWIESLYLASDLVNQSGSKNPQVHNKLLQCFRYFHSLYIQDKQTGNVRTIRNKSELPKIHNDIFTRSLAHANKQSSEARGAWAPFCIGHHVFMRDPKEDKKCEVPTFSDMRIKGPSDDKFRETFFKDCLPSTELFDPMPTGNAPDISMCRHNSPKKAAQALRAVGIDESIPGLFDQPGMVPYGNGEVFPQDNRWDNPYRRDDEPTGNADGNGPGLDGEFP